MIKRIKKRKSLIALYSLSMLFAAFATDDDRTDLNEKLLVTKETNYQSMSDTSHSSPAPKRKRTKAKNIRATQIEQRWRDLGQNTEAHVDGCCNCMTPFYRWLSVASAASSTFLIGLSNSSSTDSSGIRIAATVTGGLTVLFTFLEANSRREDTSEDERIPATASPEKETSLNTHEVTIDVKESKESKKLEIQSKPSDADEDGTTTAPATPKIDNPSSSVARPEGSPEIVVDSINEKILGTKLYESENAEDILLKLSSEDQLLHLRRLRADFIEKRVPNFDELILKWAGYKEYYKKGRVKQNIGSLFNASSDKVRKSRWKGFVKKSIKEYMKMLEGLEEE
ncbi:MAG TPA: hypothetical protein VG935_02195 [Patescibacteria group bacterium]|nr:hypothetical protein [Patescibacteria group bacterium]